MSTTSASSWVRLCHVDELPPGRPLARVIGTSGQDRDQVCVVATKSGPAAMLNRCPHRDIALSEGIVQDNALVCPGHFWRFDLGTGARRDRPDDGLTLYPVRVVDGFVEACVPDAAPRLSMREGLLAQR